MNTDTINICNTMKVIYVVLTTTVVCCSCKNTMQQETAYEGKDISGIIRIFIDKDTKVSTLDIETNGIMMRIIPVLRIPLLNYLCRLKIQ